MSYAVMCDQCGTAVAGENTPRDWFNLSVPDVPEGDTALGRALMDALRPPDSPRPGWVGSEHDLCSAECVKAYIEAIIDRQSKPVHPASQEDQQG